MQSLALSGLVRVPDGSSAVRTTPDNSLVVEASILVENARAAAPGTRLAVHTAVQIRFDRGTILIAHARDTSPERLPGVAWDPRVRSWRAPADAYEAVVSQLSRDAIAFRSELVEHTTATAGWSMPELRWYQREALAAWGAASRRGVIALPTGAGKTVIAVAAIARSGVSALCLVPTRVLLDQWATVLARYLREVGRLGDGQHTIAPVTVATYASAIAWAPKIGDRFGLVVVDEAHHVGAECPGEVLEMLVATARLGLTATPPVGDAGLALERHVGSVVYALAVDDLVGDALADFDLMTIPIRLTADERARYGAARELFGAAFSAFQHASPGADWQAFVTAAMRSEDGRRALAAWRTSKDILAYPDDKRRVLRELLRRHAAQRTLVFTQDNRTAYEVARELLVYPVTHEIGRKERARVLERFNAGDINAIVSAQVLDEGLDVPEAEIAIVVGGIREQPASRAAHRAGAQARAGQARARVRADGLEHGRGRGRAPAPRGPLRRAGVGVVTSLPVRQHGERASLDLLDEHDAPWISALIDEVEAALGRPWRELLERIARLPVRTAPARRAAALDALRRMLSGRERGALEAADVRQRLLGRSALDRDSRDARLAAVAAALATTVEQLELAMWADLPAERSLVMPRGRPTALAVAAAANLSIIQRALMRCHELRLQVSGNARAIARTAAVRGLLATARARGHAVDLEISGPLAMFHRTTVYGRALASIVPHLAWCERFVVDARCDFGRGPAVLRLQPPILLPPAAEPSRYDSALEARFAREMSRLAPRWRVAREPEPIDADGRLAFPDFLLEHRDDSARRWWLEIVGFWTSDYLRHKLATYRAARLPRVILCIDAKRTVDERDLPSDARIIRFTKSIPAEQVLAIIEAASP